MADRLSWTELRRALAARAGVSERQAATFLSAFQAQLITALKNDKLVKINGLGTFRVQPVAPRKSVDISTGEEIVIEGYNKVAFAPEAGVRELVESLAVVHSDEPQEPVEAVDPIKKLGAQAEEIVDILGELGQGPKEEEKKEEQQPQPEIKIENKIELMEPKEEKTYVPEERPYKPYIPEEEPKKNYHFVRDTLICVVILLLLLLIGYFFFRQQISGWLEQWTQPKQETEVVVEVEEPAAEPVEEISEWHYDQILLTERLTPGSRLAWLAKKHYGDRDLWPYIYMANKDRLTNPSDILIGTPIRVPKLTEADRDMSTKQFQRIKAEAEAAIQE